MSRRSGLTVALGLAFAVFVVDQGIKAVVEGSMRVGESVEVVPGFLSLTHIKNDGGAFGILDRLSTGVVTDYVHFSFWYIFNAADAAITVGVVLLLLSTLWPERTPRPSAVGDSEE
jgi:signal peptidase II